MHSTSHARVLGVLGLSGGVGASTMAATMAWRLALSGRSVLLIDGHPLGGGLDLLLGEDVTGDLRWPHLAGVRGVLDSAAVLGRLPRTDGCAVLSWDRCAPASAELPGEASVWSQLSEEVDVTVVDLPGAGRHAARSWVSACTDVVGVVGSGVTGVAAAMVGLDALDLGAGGHRPGPRLAGVLVRATWPPATEAIARALDVPVLGVARDDPGVERALERGEPVGATGGPVCRLADQVLATVLVQDRGAA